MPVNKQCLCGKMHVRFLENNMPVIALNSGEHRQLRVSPPENFKYLENVHMLPLVAQECGHAGNEFPVAFVKDAQTDRFQLVAVLGLQEGENLFVSEGQWRGMYMPAIIQIEPFKLISDAYKPDELVAGLDTDSERVQESEGEALFDDAGNETEFLQRVKDSLGQYFQNQRYTLGFTAALSGLGLLVARDLSVKIGDQNTTISGLHIIDEEKLNALSDEHFAELRKQGFLAAVYAQMLSLNQIHRLARIKAATSTPSQAVRH